MMQKITPFVSKAVKVMSFTAIGFLLITFTAKLSFCEEHLQNRRMIDVHWRVKRATNCTTEFITESDTSEPDLPARYTAEQLDACLEKEVLSKNLSELGNIAFSRTQLLVLKKKLEDLYPGGLPQEQILHLGFIITVYGAEEISTWNITDPNTLAYVISNSPNFNTTVAILTNYVQKKGILNTPVLNAIDGNILCGLSEEILQKIPPAELKRAKPLNISACTQRKKDIIYGIAKTAFQDQANNFSAYYPLIKPYIPGAKVTDLKSLADGNINMDYATFSTLNPEEVEKLSANDIRKLLGRNLNDLKTNEQDLIVMRWIYTHSPEDVESLGIGLQRVPSLAGIGNIVFSKEPDSNSASSNSYSILISFCITVISITIQSIL
ncbi:mesothelin-like protein isoform X2 [Mobula hypostoma]